MDVSPRDIKYITATDFIERFKKDHAEYVKLWAGLSDDQMLQRPGPQADWSVKDLIAHLTWWQDHMLEWVEMAISGETVVRDETVDEANARVFEEKKDLPLATVMKEWDASYPKVLAVVETMTDEQINDASVVNIEGHALMHFLIGDTFGHYDSHRADLEAYVNSLK